MSLDSFFGFAIMVDLRNFSEVCRRLVVSRPVEKPLNRVKIEIYQLIFNFITSTLDRTVKSYGNLFFDYKHTGDGFLFVTRHALDGDRPNSVDSFIFLLELYQILEKEVPRLNSNVGQVLCAAENQRDINQSRQLSYIQSLFKESPDFGQRPYLDFSVGVQCGTIFFTSHNAKKLVLGNCINLAARFQQLSKVFVDYHLFFSNVVPANLRQSLKLSTPRLVISSRLFKDLDNIEIRGIGPTRIQTIAAGDILGLLNGLKRCA